jgi:hypothetical protein
LSPLAGWIKNPNGVVLPNFVFSAAAVTFIANFYEFLSCLESKFCDTLTKILP